MKYYYFPLFLALLFLTCKQEVKESKLNSTGASANYLQNRLPLKPVPYLELPLGSIKPTGWLDEQLQRMASGLTGNLDTIYPEVVGPRNGWLGGDGDGWERGPYWIDGLLPLAYILDDVKLIAKVQPWIEWTLQNQTEEGYIGPIPFETEPENEPGLQRGQRTDWWPKMVMLKVLQQYYTATQDERVIQTLTNYFKYQLKDLPQRPLDELSFWANRRGGDNLQVVYWLYNITGDPFLLQLGDLIHEQTFPWTTVFLNDTDPKDSVVPYKFYRMKGYPFDTTEINGVSVSQIGSIHTVNFAQGLKAPVIRYQKEPDPRYIDAVKKALYDIKKYHGQPQGMYGGDEPLHGTDPVQGIEFCSISEEMFSLESMIKITGDMQFADLLEKIAYNALPTQASDDYMSRQYFQAANQVELTDRLETSFETASHKGTDFVFGTLTGYPCCTTNMHQSWPKFVQNLFYGTNDGGVAALQYAPSTVRMKVVDNVDLKVMETTGFPFREVIRFELELSEAAAFPFHFRIPYWTTNPRLTINGEEVNIVPMDGIVIVERPWQDGDRIELLLPMAVTAAKWHAGSVSIERGPLVYALGIKGENRQKDRGDGYGEFTEVYPQEAWNYGLVADEVQNLAKAVEVTEREWEGQYPWNLEAAPIELKLTGVQLPWWKLVKGAPVLPDPGKDRGHAPRNLTSKIITLVPYGCTTLRITEFPEINFKK